MHLKFSDVTGLKSEKSITIGQSTFLVRPLTPAEEAMLTLLVPPPAAPMRKNPNAGSLAPLVPDLNDQEYLGRRVVWMADRMLLEAMVACEYETSGGLRWKLADEEGSRAWCTAVLEETRATLSRVHVSQILDAAREAGKDASGQVRGSLIVELSATQQTPKPLPEVFGRTRLCQLLAVCERFGQDPITYLPRLAECQEADVDLLVAYDQFRTQLELQTAG